MPLQIETPFKSFMPVEPFTIVLALLPLIGYLLVLGTVRISGRVLVTTGGRDVAALGMAISGLCAVGPAELFFPNHAAIVFGPLVWVALGEQVFVLQIIACGGVACGGVGDFDDHGGVGGH